jgi:hypothetical protein
MHRRHGQGRRASRLVHRLGGADHPRHRPVAVLVLEHHQQVGQGLRDGTCVTDVGARLGPQRVEAPGLVGTEPIAQRLDRNARAPRSGDAVALGRLVSKPLVEPARLIVGCRVHQVADQPVAEQGDLLGALGAPRLVVFHGVLLVDGPRREG